MLSVPEVLRHQTAFVSVVRISDHAAENYVRRIDSNATVESMRDLFRACEPATPYVKLLTLQYASAGKENTNELFVCWDPATCVVFTWTECYGHTTAVSVYCLDELERFNKTGQFIQS